MLRSGLIGLSLAVFATACSTRLPGGGGREDAPPAALRMPATDGRLHELCHRPAHSFAAARALLDSIAEALASTGTSPGPYVMEQLPAAAGRRIASVAIRGDTAVISVSQRIGGHSLYHELIHAWAARLPPEHARAMVDSVFAGDLAGEWPPEVALWASASYLSVINGLGSPRGFTAMTLSVTASVLDMTQPGRLARLYDATSRIVDRAPAEGEQQTIADALEGIAAAHWRYAGHTRPRGWNGAMERRFILASEVLAYALERSCLGR